MKEGSYLRQELQDQLDSERVNENLSKEPFDKLLPSVKQEVSENWKYENMEISEETTSYSPGIQCGPNEYTPREKAYDTNPFNDGSEQSSVKIEVNEEMMIAADDSGFIHSNPNTEENSASSKCNLCDYITGDSNLMKSHVNCVHLELKDYHCHYCDYSSNREYNLKKHIDSVHLQLRDFNCDFCDFSSTRKGDLKKHVVSIHLQLKNHKCNFCDFSTSRKCDLNKHIDSVHLKLRKFKCTMCAYRTSRKENLKHHNDAVHLKFKPEKCLMCDFSATAKRTLKMHVESVHLHLKNFKCDRCSYSCSKKCNLKVHIESVHLREKHYHMCDMCDYKTRRRDYFQKHKALMHSSSIVESEHLNN